jgi:hypothetical protein
LLERYPHQLDDRFTSYCGMLLNVLNHDLDQKNFASLTGALEKVQSVFRSKQDRIHKHLAGGLMEFEIRFYIAQGRFAEAAAIVPRINELLFNQHASVIDALSASRQSIFEYNFFVAYFGNNDYKNASSSIQKIMSFAEQDIREDVQCIVRISNLILQYEQGEYIHLGYALRSTYRYLQKRKRVYRMEGIVIDFLRKAIGLQSDKQLLEALAELKKQVAPLIENPFEKSFFADFPLLEWIESKLQKRNLAEIMKEQYLRSLATVEDDIS